ncbi:MAG TPA: LUD domain-containing protein [Methylomirabilota bacterium]|jgi:iron-sulfur cluster protein|nr:LUD domain-containing protein [Methylomirabilota bacterium]
MTSPIAPFPERYRKALADRQLGRNLLNFQRAWGAARRATFEHWETQAGLGVPDPSFAAHRARLTDAKRRAIRDRVTLFARFKEAAEAAGATVYESTSAADAVRYVVDLCRRRGVSLVAKGKTMVSEELFLNHALEAAGVAAVETDLGEWIIQLARETPSHMVMPAIHKSRQQVGGLFEAHVGRPVSREDIAEMAGVARGELRRVFAEAQIGITGANALIAETGTIMLVTNEGNGRLTSSLPPVHVVLVGWEKLLPTWDDVAAQVRLLARSGTAQDISVYTTFITGPDRADRELHIVIVDNGRSEMAADPAFADALRCIRCAACADVCPPYQVVGGHAFGFVYSGAIGLVNTSFHHGLEAAAGPQSLCVSCNACATVCPVDIPLPRLILNVRHQVGERFGLPWRKRWALAVWSRPRLFAAALGLGRWLQTPFVRGRQLRLPLPEAFRWRTAPALARRPARATLLGREFAPAADGPLAGSGARGLTVAYFLQCVTDRFAPEQAAAAVRVLAACGARVVVPRGQHCCGLPALDAGDRGVAAAMARQTIAALEAVRADWIVTAAASCAIAVGHDYAELLRDNGAWRPRAEALAARTLDLVTFLDRVAKLPAGALARSRATGPLTYHSFCQSANVLGIAEIAPRLLRAVCGFEVRDLPEAAVCCGFGGSTSLDHPEMAREIAARKLDNVARTEATVLVTDNPGCLLHLRGAADARGLQLRVAHIAEILAEQLAAGPGTLGSR